MADMDEVFDRLRNFLWKRGRKFCVVYRIELAQSEVGLKWILAVAVHKMTVEECAELAAQYENVALYCYQNSRNLILKEVPSRRDYPMQNWCGLSVSTEANKAEPQVDAQAQQWWLLVVGNGVTRDTGHTIVTRVAASNEDQVRECIAGIQDIMSRKTA